jgi:hypothetical protein
MTMTKVMRSCYLISNSFIQNLLVLETLKLSMESIVSLEWSTTEKMKIRTGTYSPTLLFDVPDPSTKKAFVSSTILNLFSYIVLLDCVQISYGIEFCGTIEEGEEEEEEEEEEEGKEKEEQETSKKVQLAKEDKTKKTTLALFEHVLKLCVLERAEEKDHYLINDEKLYLTLR